MDKAYLRIRNFLGILGCLLPFLSVGFSVFSPNINKNGWWYSISVTYYSTPVLTAVLSAVGFFLIMYRSYDKWDTIVNTAAGVFALFVVCFPCTCPWFSQDTKVGIFYIPMNVSNILHCVSAALLFVLLSLNSLLLFTKGTNKKKNLVYRICAIIMFVFLLIFCLNFVFIKIEFLTIFFESIMLIAFGFSWLTKGHLLDFIFEMKS